MQASSIFALSATALLSLACALGPEALGPFGAPPDGQDEPFPNTPSGFAVVELFTSEGCSSCPPADVVAEKLARRASASGRPVHVLAFHVDYWNRLGWPDRFSSAEYTSRQRRYAGVIAEGRLYTPQMVVNGREEFVGSRKEQADRLVRAALEKTPGVTITLARISPGEDANAIRVTGRASGASLDGLVLCAAVVENDLVTAVERGENRGRTLHHARVVRVFKTFEIAAEFEIDLPLAGEIDRAKSAVVVFVQHDKTLAIVGAAERDLIESSGTRPKGEGN